VATVKTHSDYGQTHSDHDQEMQSSRAESKEKVGVEASRGLKTYTD
jgi:hypothetical protein